MAYYTIGKIFNVPHNIENEEIGNFNELSDFLNGKNCGGSLFKVTIEGETVKSVTAVVNDLTDNQYNKIIKGILEIETDKNR